MRLGLEGKKALVTGSTAGIGFASALGLAREGAQVVVNGRTGDRVEKAVRALQSKVPAARVTGVAADFATAAAAEKIARAVPALDVLVNNVGVFEPKPFEEISDADWQRFFQINVMSGVRLSRLYLPKMLERNWGRIVFVSSESALQIPAEMIHYGTTKTAPLRPARGLAERTVRSNVTVNAVLPGPTCSEGVGRFVADLARTKHSDERSVEREFFRETRPSSLLQRFATPEEVANLIVYVCSEAASATNGAALRVDGGVVRAIV